VNKEKEPIAIPETGGASDGTQMNIHRVAGSAVVPIKKDQEFKVGLVATIENVVSVPQYVWSAFFIFLALACILMVKKITEGMSPNEPD
jgi:hypothetical protein